jgi:hypothetical protein
MPIGSSRRLQADENFFDPIFRPIYYTDDDLQPMHVVSDALRLAWAVDVTSALSLSFPEGSRPALLPPPIDDCTSPDYLNWAGGLVIPFIRAAIPLSQEEKAALPRSPDQYTTDTDWRKAVACIWCNVFADVSGFIETFYDHGHYHKAVQSLLPLDFPKEGESTKIERTWETNMLALPAYLAPEVRLRVTRTRPSGDEEIEIGVFDKSNPYELWYLRRDTKYNFYVEGAEAKEGERALVLVLGHLCRESHAEE